MSDKDTLQVGPYILDLNMIQALGLSEADALSAVEARAMEHMSSRTPKNYTSIGTDVIINQQLVGLLGLEINEVNKLIPHIAEGEMLTPEQTKEYLANNGVYIGL